MRAGQQREVLAAGEVRARTSATRPRRRPGRSPRAGRRGTSVPKSAHRAARSAGPGRAASGWWWSCRSRWGRGSRARRRRDREVEVLRPRRGGAAPVAELLAQTRGLDDEVCVAVLVTALPPGRRHDVLPVEGTAEPAGTAVRAARRSGSSRGTLNLSLMPPMSCRCRERCSSHRLAEMRPRCAVVRVTSRRADAAGARVPEAGHPRGSSDWAAASSARGGFVDGPPKRKADVDVRERWVDRGPASEDVHSCER